jgi:hypothetical protein
MGLSLASCLGPFGRASAVAKTAVAVATLIKWLLW